MIIELPTPWILTLNLTLWPALQLTLAYTFLRLPARWFNSPPSLPKRESPALYESYLAIRRWKDHLPDGAKWVGGSFTKKHLTSHHPNYLLTYIRETRRGELCHWTALACTPAFFLWNPWWANLIITSYALLANLPCILTQRYNRLRLSQTLLRKSKEIPLNKQFTKKFLI